MARCLALLERDRPELAAVVRGWDKLPPAMQAGIAAMVRTALPADADGR
ncbi:MAG: hypothetical protein AB1716_09565 [Planctomycetota bacterium]